MANAPAPDTHEQAAPRAPEPFTPHHPGSHEPDAATARTELESLIAAARFSEAEALFAQLPPELDQEWFVRAGLALARRRADHAQTLAFATRLQSFSPLSPPAFGAASHALRALRRPREALVQAEAGLKHFPRATGLLQEAAQAAEAADDTERAYASWAALRAAQPKSAEGYVGAIQLSVRKQQPDVTRTLLEEGLAAFPGDRKLRLAAARHAVRSQLWADAAMHWNVLTAEYPDDAPLALEAAISFIGPRAGRRRRMPQVFAQLTALQQRFPDFAPACTASINALREAGRLEEAAPLASTWRERFPGNQDLAIACARVAEEQGRHAEAAAMLEATRAGVEPTVHLEAAYLRALSLAGHDDQAERAAEAALARFPGDMRIIERYVALATRRGDFAEAAARAGRLARQYPGNAAITRLVRKVDALQQDGEPQAQPGATPSDDADSLAAFITRFESLGGTSNGCEFGIVQRRFGAEPLGLLRWANMTIAGLTSGLRDRFAGLGDPETTRIVVHRNAANNKEYCLFDDRYAYWSHTFINAEDAPADRVLKQSIRRLTFLRAKFLEDLELGSKVFVLKMPRHEGHDALVELHDAFAAYGGGTLLVVTLEDDSHKRGTVEMLRPGLFLGRVAIFMDAGVAEERGIDADLWRQLCEQVLAWHDARSPANILAEA